MKKNFLFLMAVIATALAFSSCSKDEPKEPEYCRASYEVTVEDGLSAIYDFKLTTTTADGEVKESPFLYETNIVSWREFVKNFKVKFKLVGTLKPNAAEIINDLASKHVIISIGFSYSGTVGVYSDKEYKKLKRTLYSESETYEKWVSPNDLKEFLPRHTLVVFDKGE